MQQNLMRSTAVEGYDEGRLAPHSPFPRVETTPATDAGGESEHRDAPIGLPAILVTAGLVLYFVGVFLVYILRG